MVVGKGGGLLDNELVRQLAQTGDTYHRTASLKGSIIFVLIGMILVAMCLTIIYLVF